METATVLNPFSPAGGGIPEAAPEPAEIRSETMEITSWNWHPASG